MYRLRHHILSTLLDKAVSLWIYVRLQFFPLRILPCLAAHLMGLLA